MEGGSKTGDLSVFLRLDEARETLAKGERELESLKQTQVKLDLLSSQEAHGGDSQELGSCDLPLIEQLSWLDRASQHVTWCQVRNPQIIQSLLQIRAIVFEDLILSSFLLEF